MNECKGLLKPVGLKIGNRKSQIAYECQTCGKKVFCVVATDDDQSEILKLGSKVWRD